jgi:hypothetical protein
MERIKKAGGRLVTVEDGVEKDAGRPRVSPVVPSALRC